MKGKYHLTYEFLSPGKGNIFIYTDKNMKGKVIIVNKKNQIDLNVSDDFIGSISIYSINGPSQVIVRNNNTSSEHIIQFNLGMSLYDQIYLYDLEKDMIVRLLPPNTQPKIPDNTFVPEERTIPL